MEEALLGAALLDAALLVDPAVEEGGVDVGAALVADELGEPEGDDGGGEDELETLVELVAEELDGAGLGEPVRPPDDRPG